MSYLNTILIRYSYWRENPNTFLVNFLNYLSLRLLKNVLSSSKTTVLIKKVVCKNRYLRIRNELHCAEMMHKHVKNSNFMVNFYVDFAILQPSNNNHISIYPLIF